MVILARTMVSVYTVCNELALAMCTSFLVHFVVAHQDTCFVVSIDTADILWNKAACNFPDWNKYVVESDLC